MSQYVLEGTWEEIKSHEAELLGHTLRVTIVPERRAAIEEDPSSLSPADFTSAAATEALAHIWNDPKEDEAWAHL